MTKRSGWIGVDLDGTIAKYDKWRGEFHIGDPIEPMIVRVKNWLAEGYEVRIMTARVSMTNERDNDAVRDAIVQWCIRHVGVALPVTNIKDYAMIELWDDRAIAVEQNTGRKLGGVSRCRIDE